MDYGIGRCDIRRCDICVEFASTIINDMIEVTKPEDRVRRFVIHSGHRFCQEHKRLPREYQLADGYKVIPDRVIVEDITECQ